MSLYQRPGSPYFWCKFEFNGQRIRRSSGFTSRREAETFERRLRKEIRDDHASGAVDDKRATIDDVMARYWIAVGKSASSAGSMQLYITRIIESVGAKKLYGDIGNPDVAKFAEQMDTLRLSGATVNRHLELWRAVHRKARDEWELAVRPISWKLHRRKQERVRAATHDEARRLIDALPEHISLIAMFSFATGCRQREAFTLRKNRINSLTRQAEVDTKGGGTRFVPLNEQAMRVLSMVPDYGTEYVFDSTNFAKHWRRALKEAGVKDFRWHDMRHTFATWMGEMGSDPATVMKALGHANISVTMKYRHVFHTEVRDAVNRLPDIVGPVLAAKTAMQTSESVAGHKSGRHWELRKNNERNQKVIYKCYPGYEPDELPGCSTPRHRVRHAGTISDDRSRFRDPLFWLVSYSSFFAFVNPRPIARPFCLAVTVAITILVRRVAPHHNQRDRAIARQM
jgi:integrase